MITMVDYKECMDKEDTLERHPKEGYHKFKRGEAHLINLVTGELVGVYNTITDAAAVCGIKREALYRIVNFQIENRYSYVCMTEEEFKDDFIGVLTNHRKNATNLIVILDDRDNWVGMCHIDNIEEYCKEKLQLEVIKGELESYLDNDYLPLYKNKIKVRRYRDLNVG